MIQKARMRHLRWLSRTNCWAYLVQWALYCDVNIGIHEPEMVKSLFNICLAAVCRHQLYGYLADLPTSCKQRLLEFFSSHDQVILGTTNFSHSLTVQTESPEYCFLLSQANLKSRSHERYTVVTEFSQIYTLTASASQGNSTPDSDQPTAHRNLIGLASLNH